MRTGGTGQGTPVIRERGGVIPAVHSHNQGYSSPCTAVRVHMGDKKGWKQRYLMQYVLRGDKKREEYQAF
jgi:hypothetical protein